MLFSKDRYTKCGVVLSKRLDQLGTECYMMAKTNFVTEKNCRLIINTINNLG